MQVQQGNTLRHSLFSCHILAAAQLCTQELTEVKHMGLFRWFSSSALEGTAPLPFRGSCRSSNSLCSAGKGLLSSNCDNLHGNLHCNPLSPCHPQKSSPKS